MAAPGWHPDPLGRHQLRWYDGAQWTANVSDGGVTGTDPMGASSTPGSGRSGRTALVVIGGAAVLALVAVGAFALLGGDDGPSGPLTDEIAGVQELLDGADPDDDDVELLGDECIVDYEDLLEEAGTDMPATASDEEAGAYNAVDFDDHFYDCYVAVEDVGYTLDSVELDEDVTADNLFDLLEESYDEAELLDDGVHGGAIIEACYDLEFTDEDGETVEDPFCDFFWTYDGAGLSIIVGANESLDLDGPAVLDTVIPPFREALRDAGG